MFQFCFIRLPFTPATQHIKGKRSKKQLPPWWHQLANTLTPDADLMWRPAARVPPFRFEEPEVAARDIQFDTILEEVQDWIGAFYQLEPTSGNEWFFFDIYPSQTWVNIPEALSLLERISFEENLIFEQGCFWTKSLRQNYF